MTALEADVPPPNRASIFFTRLAEGLEGDSKEPRGWRVLPGGGGWGREK